MLTFRKTALSLCMAAGLTSGAWAQTDAADHDQHHPAQPQTQTKPATKTTVPKVAQKKAAPAPATKSAVDPALMATMDKHIQAMQSMHAKVLAAKTPEERQALMAEHAQLMRDGISLMHQMGGGMGMSQGPGASSSGMMSGNMMGNGMMGMGAQTNAGTSAMPDMSQRQQMMEKRMDMMESMMQMMMDRMPPTP